MCNVRNIGIISQNSQRKGWRGDEYRSTVTSNMTYQLFHHHKQSWSSTIVAYTLAYTVAAAIRIQALICCGTNAAAFTCESRG